MWVADNWKDYKVIDATCGEKLEKWGKYILIRPEPQVIWKTKKSSDWKQKMDITIEVVKVEENGSFFSYQINGL